LKILHLTCNDARTGGAKAVHRLHVALLGIGIDSRVLLGADEDKSDTERHVPRTFLWRLADKPVRMVEGYTGLRGTARPSFRLWRRAIDAFGPDVVHIHWSYSIGSPPLVNLRGLAAAYPILWTFHDMWAFTGGCTNSKGCERWMTGCGSCPILATGEFTGAMLPTRRDLTALQWRVKRWALGGTPLTIVAPSSWMADLARRSPIVSRAAVVCVPNPVDTSLFRPWSKAEARQSLGIPSDKLVLCYIGKPDSVFAYEGRAPLLLEALRLVRADNPLVTREVRLLIIGGQGSELLASSGYEGVAVGAVNKESEMASLLAASDIMVNTTQYDNLPGVVQEAMSCGTAVVASRVGGLPSMIEHEVSGLLVEPTSPRAFADAIQLLLIDSNLRGRLGTHARLTATERYDSSHVAAAMVAVYERSRRS
jgi:glycosyltransferase involved in cell wall biosynthesis